MGDCSETPLDAGQVCPDLAARRVNFFSGRLLGADDLRQEQGAVSQRDRWLGTAIGAGVAHGLEVAAVAGAANLLQVAPGLALNGCGEPLALDRPLRLRLAPPVSQAGAGGFAPCGSEAGFVMDRGEGYYLVSLAPAVGLSGEKAQEMGRDGQLIACGARWRLEGISLQVDKLPAAALPAALRGAPPAGDPMALSLTRSLLARLCLGEVMAAVPLARPEAGLLRVARLDPPERVPLALVAWTGAGIAFVDRWAVRRSPAPEAGASHWPVGGQRAAQAEAMQRQFQEHLAELLPVLGPAGARMAADDGFLWLPPVGVLPRFAQGKGVDAQAFFSALPTRSLFLARAALEPLLRDGLAYPPMDLAEQPAHLVWCYQLVEDPDLLVFASGHLPPANPARFDLARYDAARYPDGELGLD